MSTDAETKVRAQTLVAEAPEREARTVFESDVPPALIEQDLRSLPQRAPPEKLALLGKGGMAEVHLVLDSPLGREVALKRMRDHEETDPLRKYDFVREARITGQLQHPNVVPVYFLAADESGEPFFAMQVVEGRNLRQWLSHPRRAVGSRERLEKGIGILLRVCDAVAYAHSKGLLHRDIKPENIMVGPYGQVYLMDWGLSTELDGKIARTGGDAVAGTVGYMAPEQARAEPLDERADVFGLGAVLYKIVTGALPYSDSNGSMMRESVAGNVTPIESVPDLTQMSRGLAQVINRAVAPDKAHRYRTVEEFQEDLRKFLHSGLHLPTKEFHQDDPIIIQGEQADAAYMILEGSCRVVIDTERGEKEVRTMSKGEIFGELALLLDRPRTATVIANEPTKVLVIDREAFEDRGILDDGWSSALLRALAGRFRDLEEQVRGK